MYIPGQICQNIISCWIKTNTKVIIRSCIIRHVSKFYRLSGINFKYLHFNLLIMTKMFNLYRKISNGANYARNLIFN